MSEVLLVEIDFNGKTWHLSEEGYVGDHYYAPYLAESPELELGQTKGGYINVRIGDLSIANRANERFSPFSIFGGGYDLLIKNPSTKIPVRMYWMQNNLVDALFQGTMYLQNFDTDKFDFILEDSFSDVDLLSTASDIKAELVTLLTVSLRGLGTVGGKALAEVSSPEHKLSTGDLINVINATDTDFNTQTNTTLGDKRPITVVDDNSFTYELDSATTQFEGSGTYSVRFLSKKNVPFSFGIVTREKGLIQTEDGKSGSAGFAYANPQLKLPTDYESSSDIVYIQLFDDGVLVGSGDPASTKRSIAPVAGTGGISVAHDIVTITTQSAHNLTSGSVVKIVGMSPDGFNTRTIGIPIGSTPTTTTFTYFNNTEIDSGTTTTVTSSGSVIFAGEYFGAVRSPTADTIFSRQIVDTLTAGQTQASEDGSTTYNADDGVILVGTALVSGESKNGKTIADFFSYVAQRLGIPSVDFSNAPNASSLDLQIWETSQTKILDFAGEIALGANYLFQINNNILKVFDRAFIPETFTRIENYTIISVTYKMPNPIKALRSNWSINIVNDSVNPASLTQRDESVMISNSPSGEIREIPYVTKNLEDQREVLNSIKNILNKPVITANIGSIRNDLKIGSRVKFNRQEDGVTVDMMIRTISYDFSGLQTQIVGDGSITVIEQDAIY